MPASAHIFHFTGNLQLQLESALMAWQKAFREKHGELNLSRCTVEDISPAELASELSTPPFLAEKRLTLVRIPPIPKPKGGFWEAKNPKKNSLSSFPEYENLEYWKRVLKNIPENHIVAFVGAQSIPDLEKLLSECATTKKYSAENAWEIQNHIQDKLPLISQKNAELLSERIGNDMLLLENEIQKLSLLSTLSEADIRENTIESIEVIGYHITDALLAGNIHKSRQLLRQFQSKFEKDQEFLSAMLWAMRMPGLYAGLVGNGLSPKMVAEACKLKDFVAKKYLSIPANRLRAFWSLYAYFIQSDIHMKTGKLIGEDGMLHHIEYGLLRYSSVLKGG